VLPDQLTGTASAGWSRSWYASRTDAREVGSIVAVAPTDVAPTDVALTDLALTDVALTDVAPTGAVPSVAPAGAADAKGAAVGTATSPVPAVRTAATAASARDLHRRRMGVTLREPFGVSSGGRASGASRAARLHVS
jgi:hypothetical protein